MKDLNEEIIKKYRQASFDADPARKARILAKAAAPKNRAFKFSGLYAGAAAVLLMAGYFIGAGSNKPLGDEGNTPTCSIHAQECSCVRSDKQEIMAAALKTSAPKPAPGQKQNYTDLTEEDCSQVNTRYLLAQAAVRQSIPLAKDKTCNSASALSSYDSKIIAAMEKEIMAYSKEDFTPADMDKLKVCIDKYNPKIHPLVIYRMDC